MAHTKYHTKRLRQQKIREIIESKEIATQEDLLEELRCNNLSVTQATLSRDLREIGVIKTLKGFGGYVYKIDSELTGSARALKNKFVNFVRDIEITGNLILIKTPPGEAQGVARVIDLSETPHILGTIAGDDTILVVVDTADNARKVKKMFNDLLLKKEHTRQ
ncbi:MAG: arginine repressor [bacterium]